MLKRLLVLGLCLFSINVSAFSVTNAWDVNVRQYRSMNLPIRRGESVDLVATYKSGTNLLSLSGVTNALFRYKPVTTNIYLWGMNGTVSGSTVCFPWNSSNCVTNTVVDYEIALLARNQTILRAFGKLYFDGWDNFDAYAPPPAPNIIDWATMTNYANLESAPFATDLDIATVGLNSTNYTDARATAVSNAVLLALSGETAARIAADAALSNADSALTAVDTALGNTIVSTATAVRAYAQSLTAYSTNSGSAMAWNGHIINGTPAKDDLLMRGAYSGNPTNWMWDLVSPATLGLVMGLGDIAYLTAAEFASAAQGALADTALQPDLNDQWLLNGAVFSSGDLLDFMGASLAPKMIMSDDTIYLRNNYTWLKIETNGTFFSYEDGGPAPAHKIYNQGELIASNGVLYSGGVPVGTGADDTTWRDRTNDWNRATNDYVTFSSYAPTIGARVYATEHIVIDGSAGEGCNDTFIGSSGVYVSYIGFGSYLHTIPEDPRNNPEYYEVYDMNSALAYISVNTSVGSALTNINIYAGDAVLAGAEPCGTITGYYQTYSTNTLGQELDIMHGLSGDVSWYGSTGVWNTVTDKVDALTFSGELAAKMSTNATITVNGVTSNLTDNPTFTVGGTFPVEIWSNPPVAASVVYNNPASIAAAGGITNAAANGSVGVVSNGVAWLTGAAGGATYTNWIDASAIGVGDEPVFPLYQIRTNANGAMRFLGWDKTVANSYAGPFIISPLSTSLTNYWLGYHSTTGTTSFIFRWRNGLNPWTATTSALSHATGSLTNFDTHSFAVTGLAALRPIEVELSTINTNSGTSAGYHYLKAWGWTP